VQLVKRHAVRLITTWRYHPGRHAVAVQANGRVVAQAQFDLALQPQARTRRTGCGLSGGQAFFE